MGSHSSEKNDFISLPKGGGSINGLGEKFSADLHTGTGNFSVPISVPPGRNGFQPELAITYSTGNPNSILGLGWALSLPNIKRKTSKGIPVYDDCKDVFVLSGAEDLVRVTDNDSLFGDFRPRSEGTFANIRFKNDPKNASWIVKNQNGLVSVYGTPDSAENDPAVSFNPSDPSQRFAWKITETTDPLGNKIRYQYASFSRHEPNPFIESQIQQIDYVNYIKSGKEAFLVSIAFEYEDRPDVFSSFRSGFEIQTAKRLKSITIKSNGDSELFIRKYALEYDNTSLNAISLLKQIQVVGFDNLTKKEVIELAPITFEYTTYDPFNPSLTPIHGNIPLESLRTGNLELLDLDGNGLPDLVATNDQISSFKNQGDGTFGSQRIMKNAPSSSLGNKEFSFIDANGDGRADIFQLGSKAGYFSMEFNGEWDTNSFVPYKHAPVIDLNSPNTKLIDLTGDGITDIFHSGSMHTFIFNDESTEKAWKKTFVRPRTNEPDFPNINLSDPRVKFADMNGDGMQDIVFIEGNSISYWPNKGHGNWGSKVRMQGDLTLPDHLEADRLLIGDLDGDGLADIAVIENHQVRLYINQSGRNWSDEIIIPGTPFYSSTDDARIVDLFGNGTSGILFSTNLRYSNTSNYHFLDLTSATKPYLLNEVNNHLGAITRIEYTTSTKEYLLDKSAGFHWKTHLPFPVLVVKKNETIDLVSKSKMTTLYKYHHGHWDGEEREFRGFGMVEKTDTETVDDFNSLSLFLNEVGFNRVPDKFFSPPSSTKTWFHLGPVRSNKGTWETIDYSSEFSEFDRPVFERTAVPELSKLTFEKHRRDALRAMRGQILRTEFYVYDESSLSERPGSVQEFQYDLRIEQVTDKPKDKPIIFTFPLAQRSTVWERGDDPKTQFTFSGEYNQFGHAQVSTVVSMPRRISKRIRSKGKNYDEDLNEHRILSTHTKTKYAANTPNTVFIHDRVCEISQFEYKDTNHAYFETDSTNPETILKDQLKQAQHIHQTIFASLSPTDTNLIHHQINYYDGAAFQGLPFDQTGTFGCLVRTEILAFTETLLKTCYTDNLSTNRRPLYLDGNAPTVQAPANFGSNVGYTKKNTGYYMQSVQNQFAFQTTPNTLFNGLLLASKDARGNETRFHYDTFDLFPIRVVDPLGNEIRAVYNYQHFSPSAISDPNGNTSYVSFNASGLPLKIWKQNHDGTQGGTENKPDSEFSYRLAYDFQNQIPVSSLTSSRTDHSLTPNASDTVIKTVEYSDGFGRVIQQITQADDVTFGNQGAENGLTKNQNGTNQSAIGIPNTGNQLKTLVSGWTTFNNKGVAVQKYEPFFHEGFDFVDDAFFGAHSEIYYDGFGREQRILLPDGSESIHVYGSMADLSKPNEFAPSPWEHFTYDANDLAFSAHQNTPSSLILDSLGRIIAAINRKGQNPATDWFITKSSYDIKGNIQTITDTFHREAFVYHYDFLNRVLRIDSIDAGKRTKLYDATGNLMEFQDDKGSLVLKEYDALNRIKQTWVRDNSSLTSMRLAEKVVYGDDPGLASLSASAYLKGKPVKHFDEAGLTTYSQYDFKNNILEKSRQIFKHQHIGSAINWSTLSENDLQSTQYLSTYKYDGLNRTSEYLYPADVTNHRARLQANYNASGKLQQVRIDGKVFVDHLAYNAKNQRLLIAYGNNTMTRYAYHEDNFRLLRLRTESYTTPTPFEFKPNGTVFQDTGYNYDPVGNIVSIHHRENGSGLPNDPNKLDRLFEYDAIYRLLSATGRETERPNPMADVLGIAKSSDINLAKAYSEKYSYDEAGNFMELKHLHDGQQTVRSFTNESPNNRLREVDFSGTRVGYSYDLNGNLTDEGLSRRMTWNHSDRMTKFVIHDTHGNNSVEADYAYDSTGMRVAKKIRKGTNTVLTIYIDGLFEHTIDLSQNKENNHLHIMDDKTRIAVLRIGDSMGDNKPAVQYHLGDHLGSSSICIGGTDASGKIQISREEYYAFGETAFGSHAKKRYRYSGKERDEESGMYYYGSRYYLPWTARWASCDPIGVEGGMNLYQFVAGNPMKFVDETGCSPEITVNETTQRFIVDKIAEEFRRTVDELNKGNKYLSPQQLGTLADNLVTDMKYHTEALGDVKKFYNYENGNVTSIDLLFEEQQLVVELKLSKNAIRERQQAKHLVVAAEKNWAYARVYGYGKLELGQGFVKPTFLNSKTVKSIIDKAGYIKDYSREGWDKYGAKVAKILKPLLVTTTIIALFTSLDAYAAGEIDGNKLGEDIARMGLPGEITHQILENSPEQIKDTSQWFGQEITNYILVNPVYGGQNQ